MPPSKTFAIDRLTISEPLLVDGVERRAFDAKDGFVMTNHPTRGVIVCKTPRGGLHLIPLRLVTLFEVECGKLSEDEQARVVELFKSWDSPKQ